jgi:hypothetical protein
MGTQRLTGIAAIALGIGFNIPYAILASIYDYPAILRQPAGIALERFAEGGAPLVLAWYGFMLAALALVPLALSLALTPGRIASSPALAVGAAITGSLAGLTQAIGLSRWVFVIPEVAGSAEREAAARAFDILNAFGGVAIGEHLGQLLTALFVAQIAALQQREGAIGLTLIGKGTAAAITIGTGEGLALALGADGAIFSIATILGFLGLSGWLITTGWQLAGRQQQATPIPA